MAGIKTDLLLEAQAKGFSDVTDQLTKMVDAINKISNKKFSNTGAKAFTTEVRALGSAIEKLGTDQVRAINKMGVELDKALGSMKKLNDEARKSKYSNQLEMGWGFGSMFRDMEKMFQLQARWYLSRAVLFSTLEIPIVAIKSIGSYVLELDKARAELMRWGATSGRVTAEMGKDADNLVLQIRKATMQYPVMFKELKDSVESFVGAGIDSKVVAKMVPTIAQMQTAFKEIDFKQFSIALSGALNVFGGNSLDQAKTFANIVDKIMKAQAVGIIRPEQFTVVLQYLSQIGKLSGFTLDQLLAMSVAVTDTGIKAQSASRMMRSFIIGLTSENTISQFAKIGIDIDRTIPIAQQFEKILSQLSEKMGKGAPPAAWTSFLSGVFGKEPINNIITMVQNLDKYNKLQKDIEGSKGGMVAASQTMEAPISAQWQMFLNTLQNVGKELSGSTGSALSTLVIWARDIANGMLVAADSTGKFSDQLIKLGPAGETAAFIIQHLRDSIRWLIEGLVVFSFTPFINKLKTLSITFTTIEALIVRVGANIGVALTRLFSNPLIVLVIGIEAITRAFNFLNGEMDKIEKRDSIFYSSLKTATMPDLEKNISTYSTQLKTLIDLDNKRKEFFDNGAVSIRGIKGKQFFASLSEDEKKLLLQDGSESIKSKQDALRWKIAATRTEILSREREIALNKKTTDFDKNKDKEKILPPQYEKWEDSRIIAAAKQSYKNQLDNDKLYREGLLDNLDTQYKQAKISDEEYDLGKRKIVQDRFNYELLLINLEREQMKNLYSDARVHVMKTKEQNVGDNKNKINALNEEENVTMEMLKKRSQELDLAKQKDTNNIDINLFNKRKSQTIEFAEFERKINNQVADDLFAAKKAQVDEAIRLAKDEYDHYNINASKYISLVLNNIEKEKQAEIEKNKSIANEAHKILTVKMQFANSNEKEKLLKEDSLIEKKQNADDIKANEEALKKISDFKIKTKDDMRIEYEKNGIFGVSKKSLGSIVGQMTSTGEQIKQLWTDVAQSMSQSFQDFFIDALDGKMKSVTDYFKGFFRSIYSSIAAIASQRIAGSIINSFGFTNASVKHAGGIVGNAGRMSLIPSATFIGAPRLHNGLAGDEFPAILQKGETVIPKGGTSQKIKIELINQSNQKMQTTKSSTRFNGQEQVVSLWIDALRDNKFGLRDVLGG